ncbi:multiple epidermal growth factor-like domains protein 10 isoform X2 [Ostrea edulis]|uniref:multiple epidermal growth factor-like domains protein 10 isoform X2 n=1 Tax=Ostrea edulis TaxID=37623 RepID=UPI0024AFE67D|nr:multiple epidermal growth factor-like domains protein 10 isoform X2 [Ostrea edulis]
MKSRISHIAKKIVFQTPLPIVKWLDGMSYTCRVLFLYYQDVSWFKRLPHVSIHTKCKVWNTTLKKCTECDVGFQGDSCQMVCRYPNYVNQCQMWCNCEQRNCSFVTGCDYGSPTISPSIMEISFPVYLLTKTLKACRSGYTGSDCESACRYPSYGVGCQLQCKCDKNICHYVKGCERIISDGDYYFLEIYKS